MLFLFLALAPAASATPDAQVSWDVVRDHIENCRVSKSTGDPKMDAKVCAALACAQKMDVKTDRGKLWRYRKQDCTSRNAPATPKP